MPAVDPAAMSDVRRTVLLTTVHNLHDTPNFLASSVSTAARKTTESLGIVILSPFFNPPGTSDGSATTSATEERPDAQISLNGPGISRTAYWDDVQRLLTFVYVQATKVAQDMGKILLDVNVLLKATAEPFPEQIVRDADRIFSGESCLYHSTLLLLHAVCCIYPHLYPTCVKVLLNVVLQ